MWSDDFIRPRNSKSSFDDENDSECLDNVGHNTFNVESLQADDVESLQADDSYIMSPAITNDVSVNDTTPQPKTNIQQVVKNP